MPGPTISPAVLCPAIKPPNACCGAKRRRRSPACRPISREQNLGLKVYDCYRPTRAVAAMARWARQAESPDAPTKRFYPALDKRALFALGYIAAHSAHSTGIAVDLTLIARDAKEMQSLRRRSMPPRVTAPAPRPAALRAPDNSLDMGTGFDCFDDKSRTLEQNPISLNR